MLVTKIYRTTATSLERILMVTTSPTAKTEIDLNDVLLPRDPDAALIVDISEDSVDFRKGDLLVVDTSKHPAIGNFALLVDSEGSHIERYALGKSHSVHGVVTAIVRKL